MQHDALPNAPRAAAQCETQCEHCVLCYIAILYAFWYIAILLMHQYNLTWNNMQRDALSKASCQFALFKYIFHSISFN